MVMIQERNTFIRCHCCPKRYIVAFFGFLCTAAMHSHRFNITIAMVAMVNSTKDASEDNMAKTSDCPAVDDSEDAQKLRGEFTWSPDVQGYILSAGYLGYLLSQIPGGILAGMFGCKFLLVWGLFLTALCNFLSPIGARYDPYLLYALTLIRGLAQGWQQPALSVMMSKWFPRNERGFLSTFIFCGYPAGAFITGLASGPLCDLELLDGWPLVFYIFGLFGAIVGLLFQFCFTELPEDDPTVSFDELQYIKDVQENSNASKTRPATPWLSIFASMTTYGLILGLFGFHWMTFYFVTVHSLYLGTVLNIPIKDNGIQSSIPFILQTIVGFCICYFSYWLSRNTKDTVNVLRKGLNSIGSITYNIGLLGIYFSKCSIVWNQICLYVSITGLAFLCGGAIITAVDMSPTFCGPLMGFANTMASFAGFLTPVMVGNLTKDEQNLEQWGKIFLISIGVTLGCGLIFQVFGSANVQPYDPVASNYSEMVDKENNIKSTNSTPGDKEKSK